MALEKTKLIFSQKGMSREDVRRKMVELFLSERPGPAADENYNRYEYLVEETKQGNVLLTRPANLKLGFDFRIDVEGMTFLKGTCSPSHEDVFQDLKLKFNKDKNYSEDVRKAIIEVCEMNDPSDVIKSIVDKNIGHSVELLLKINKWFTIEQDIRYWNGWGRTKYIVWLKLMGFFEYNYEVKNNKFIFIDKDNNKFSEEKAMIAAGIDRALIVEKINKEIKESGVVLSNPPYSKFRRTHKT